MSVIEHKYIITGY